MPFDTYLQLRDRIEPWRGMALPGGAAAPGEQRMLAALASLWAARPEMIAGLRRLCEPITGARPEDYDDPEWEGRSRLERDAHRLMAHVDQMRVEEPEALGGFGVQLPEGRHNADTLRFLRLLSLLQAAAVLPEFRDQRVRPTVWEIGGWGGFAYQFKTLCPDVTYLVTGHAELLLLAAVYLSRLLPAARLRFYDAARPERFWDDWAGVDIAFAPESIVAGAWPVPVDLTVDIGMLERMSPERAGAHVGRAHASGSRYLVTECPAAPDDDAAMVRTAVERLYWRHPLCVPRYLGKRLMLHDPARTYLLGWRRLRP